MSQQPAELDCIAVHLAETTASAGAKWRATPWASTVRYVVENRNMLRAMHLLTLRSRRKTNDETGGENE